MTRMAGTVDFSQYMKLPDFATMGATGIQGRGLVENAINTGIGKSTLAGINAAAGVRSANYKADAIKAQGQAQGQQAMAQGFGSLFSGLAGGIGSLGGGGGGIGSVGVPRTSPGMGIPGSVAPGTNLPYYGPAW